MTATGYEEYTLPPQFRKYSSYDVWTKLNGSSKMKTVHDLLSEEQIATIQEEQQAFLSYDLAGKVVYIGADTRTRIKRVLEILDVILASKVDYLRINVIGTCC
jgi:hypothetical protein